MNVIFKTRFGSHLYGTETPTSDVAYKGVYIPSARDVLLGTVKPSINMNDKVDDRTGYQRKNEPGETDFELYSVQKYLSLVAQGDVGALDMLFATPLIVDAQLDGFAREIWGEIWNNRDRLASKKCESYLGYCRNQAAKYGVKGSRMAAAEQAAKFFRIICEDMSPKLRVREVSATMMADLCELEHCRIVAVVQGDGKPMNAFECCDRKVMFNDTVKTAYELYQRVYDEYGHRARAAKEKGIDWKALSHAVRVGNQAVEYLSIGAIMFPRPERQHLIDIKAGKIAYEEVAEEIEGLLYMVKAAEIASALPDEPDWDWINDFVCRAHRSVIHAS